MFRASTSPAALFALLALLALLALSVPPPVLAQDDPDYVSTEEALLVPVEGPIRPGSLEERRVEPLGPPAPLDWDTIRRLYRQVPSLEGIDLPDRPKRFTLSPDHPVERPYGGYLSSTDSWIHASNAPYDWRFPTIALECAEDHEQVSVALSQLAADTRYALDYSIRTLGEEDFTIRTSSGETSIRTENGDQHVVADVRTDSSGAGWVALSCEGEGPWYFYEVTVYEIGTVP